MAVSGLPLGLFLLWVHLIAYVSCITCPKVVEKTIPAGETCVVVTYQVNGKSVTEYDWEFRGVSSLKPGDCFPEGNKEFIHTIGSESCTVRIIVKGVCSWNPHHCWPGDCAPNLAYNCQCRDGFFKYSITDYTYGDENLLFKKRCRWNTKPDLNTCRVSVTDSQGHSTSSTHAGPKTDCSSQQDEYVNTQPAKLSFVLKSDFQKDFGSYVSYVSETKIGIVGANISVVKVALRGGSETTVMHKELSGRPVCQQSVSAMSPVTGGNFHDCEETLTLPQYSLKDGDRLCARMTATAGGYYKLKDSSGNHYGTETFPQTYATRDVCFLFDDAKPAHCTSTPHTTGSCTPLQQPLALSTRLSRSRHVEVTVDGWTDPTPSGGSSRSASGLVQFRLEVHGVDVGQRSLSVQHGALPNLTQEWPASRGGGPYRVQVTLPQQHKARMFALLLEVHDVAGNVAYARRLLLLDNSSSVDLLPSASLTVLHADPRTNNRWQTDVSKPLCVDWKGRFHNSEMYSNNLLQKVDADLGREITGNYDQTSGVLPVRGTDNVLGVTKFEVSWSRNGAPRSGFTEVNDLFAQTTCLPLSIHDGETYDVWVRASDVMNNSKEDSVQVSIDRTGPDVSISGLQGRWDTEDLHVHDGTDLSTMTLVVTAADPHSGLTTMGWTLSTRPLADDVGRGAVAVQRLDNSTTSCDGRASCYCPSVGEWCETDRYLVTFTNLVDSHSHQGDHHRHYYITLTATNAARLSTAATLKVLLDQSPPEVGVVWEGLAADGQAEMDFTSQRVVHVRWHGYQDPESGVRLYRVVMGERCMTGGEVDEADNATEVLSGGNTASFTFPGEGRYFFSVIAYNGALAPSKAACSDGVVYDTTPPALRNVTLMHARGGRMIACTKQQQQQQQGGGGGGGQGGGGEAWLVQENLTRVALHSGAGCQALCSGPSPGQDVQHLPVSSDHVLDPEASENYCRQLPKMTGGGGGGSVMMVLPSDYVEITWRGHDEESQIEEYYVGIGSDVTASSAPDLLPFTATHGHSSYHARHVGLGHGDVFFVFLQVLSKAGLSSTVTLGPVVIDVTAPEVTQPLTEVVVEEGLLLVTWAEGVFTDPEQLRHVEFNVSFRVGHEDGFVTPFYSTSECNLTQCQKDNITGCACYPVKLLYPYDTEDGRSFFFQLHVINAAGHVSTVNTSSVRLPSHFPPSHAVILDVVRTAVSGVAATGTDPPVTQPSATRSTSAYGSSEESSSPREPSSVLTTSAVPTSSTENPKTASIADRFSDDVDVILQAEEVCVAWKGFYHPEEINVQVGLGTKADQDDVIHFHSVSNRSPVCLNLTSVPVHTKLFSVVRATSSGGTSVFSSDGFVMIPEGGSEQSVHVFNGKGCHENDVIGKALVEHSSLAISVSDISLLPIHAGDFLFIELSPFVSQVVFENAVMLQTTFTGYQVLAETPNITAVFPHPLAANTSLQIQRCQKDDCVVPVPNNQFTFTWETTGPSASFVKYFKADVVDTTCLDSANGKDKYLLQKCTLHEETTPAVTKELTIFHENLDGRFLQDHTYVSSVSLCFDDTCLPPSTSQPVTYGASYLTVQLDHGLIEDMRGQELTLDVQASTEPVPVAFRNKTCVYMWTVSADPSGSVPLAEWVVQKSRTCSNIQITQNAPLGGSGRGTLYICLRLLFPMESNHPDCFKLMRSPSSNVHEPFHVIELSHSVFRVTDFRPFLTSQQLGHHLHDLYDLDLDFAPSDLLLSAVLTNSLDLNVTWFLMTAPRAPRGLGDCAGDEECVMSKAAHSHVTFPRSQSRFQSGKVYYACAVFAEDAGEEEEEEEPGPLARRQVCGDGVVIDDSPPVRGSVVLSGGDPDGVYLAGDNHVTVSWSGFADVEEDSPLLFGGEGGVVTLNYSVALGSYPGGEDLAPFVQVGQRTTWTFSHLTWTPGFTCIATVRAQDRVGHVTDAWSSPVIIDSTPPTVGHVAAGAVIAEDFVPGHELPVHWEGVEDKESGVLSIEVGVAQRGGGDNVVDFQTCQGTSVILTDTSALVDGHAYVVLLKVTNKAGLTTVRSSAPFVIDSSPPSPGRLWHSGSGTAIVGGYSRHVGVYSVKWAGFTDPHSGVDYYRLGLGSIPGLDDVAPFVYVGRQTSYTWTEQLEQGTAYYATLQACNRAGLCRLTSSGSLTFDDSPPTSGHVTVGLYGRHDKFLGHNSSVPVEWSGFSDPQTGLQHFTWCVGQRPRACDVLPTTHTLLSRVAHMAGLALPSATPLYVTVTAVNPAGLATVSVSDSFAVDSTPPEVMVKPQFLSLRDGGPASGQWDRSVLQLVWQFRDPESSVVSHTVYIRSQLTGRLVVDPVVLGPETQLTLPLGQTSLLTDGDVHWASVAACNAAHLCVIATSDVILIDSSPPVTGTFLPSLKWKRESTTSSGGDGTLTVIDLRWEGFSDPESDVIGYDVIAGRRYNGEELSGGKGEGGP
ncbi:uncharacterized protein LOC143288575 [Babylonia areolata]|uniref:uncharacterized protein LOC143288575 n=1 Tax=Babylonia areolata TaxID=304850 RepID=UPI003FD6A00D